MPEFSLVSKTFKDQEVTMKAKFQDSCVSMVIMTLPE